MSDFFKFLTRRIFYKHIAIYGLVVLLVLSLASIFLNYYTGHGEKMKMPDLRGKTIAEIQNIADKNGFELVVVDSIYIPEKRQGTILDHTPKPGAYIKKNRVVFLSVTSVNPEMIKMPDLVNTTLRQAQTIMESYGLQMGRLQYRPDYAENLVLAQLFGGRKIKVGQKIQKGSKIDLVLGMGMGDSLTTEIPNLVGLGYKDAVMAISGAMLNLGAKVCDGSIQSYSDSLDAYVWKQDPPYQEGQKLVPGSIIDIWLKKREQTIPNTNGSDESEINDIQ